MRIAIVPARGGSKRIKNKNIIDFLGKPMITYTLGALRDSKLFDVIHVSTDSDDIARAAGDFGLPPDFRRPDALAGDVVGTMPVLQWVVQEYRRRGKTFETIACMYPCAPLIEASDLVAAYDVFERGGRRKALQSVSTFPCPVEWAYRRKPDGTLIPVQKGAYAIRSQDLQKAYYDAGAFYFYAAEHVETDTPATDEDYTSYELPRAKAVDIDDEEDLAFAKALYAARAGARR